MRFLLGHLADQLLAADKPVVYGLDSDEMGTF
jgi:hypothetical protein